MLDTSVDGDARDTLVPALCTAAFNELSCGEVVLPLFKKPRRDELARRAIRMFSSDKKLGETGDWLRAVSVFGLVVVRFRVCIGAGVLSVGLNLVFGGGVGSNLDGAGS